MSICSAERVPAVLGATVCYPFPVEELLRTPCAISSIVGNERITLLPRMLVDVSVRDISITVLGEPVSMPILIAPTALPGLAHPEGEIATTKAAGAAKTLMTLAILSTSSIEEAMAAATGPTWFQLYVFRDRESSPHWCNAPKPPLARPS